MMRRVESRLKWQENCLMKCTWTWGNFDVIKWCIKVKLRFYCKIEVAVFFYYFKKIVIKTAMSNDIGNPNNCCNFCLKAFV